MSSRDEYPYQVKVSYSNHIPQYYNSGQYILSNDPNEGTCYKTKEAAEEDIFHATSQGGQGSVTLYTDNKIEFDSLTDDNYKLTFIDDIEEETEK